MDSPVHAQLIRRAGEHGFPALAAAAGVLRIVATEIGQDPMHQCTAAKNAPPRPGVDRGWQPGDLVDLFAPFSSCLPGSRVFSSDPASAGIAARSVRQDPMHLYALLSGCLLSGSFGAAPCRMCGTL